MQFPWVAETVIYTVNCIVAVVKVEVIDFAIKDEPAPGYSLCYAPDQRAEIRGIVLVGTSNVQKNRR
jgi:hypothetical protein